MLLLLNARKPLTVREISGSVPGYPSGEAALKQAFERDKRALRAEGIPVSTERVGGEEQVGYRIKPEEYFLGDLDLSADEQVAVNLALVGVQFLDHSPFGSLGKLGLAEAPVSSPLAYYHSSPALGDVLDAVRRRASLSFSYGRTVRRVTPLGALLRWGRWYVLAWDVERQGMRTFRVDRIEGSLHVGPDGSGQVPGGGVPEGDEMLSMLPDGPWGVGGDEPLEAIVLLDEIEAPRAVREVGESAIVEHRESGSVVIRLSVTNYVAFRSWMLGMLDHAEVLAPRDLRQDMVSWVASSAAAWGRDEPSLPEVDHRSEVLSYEEGPLDRDPAIVPAIGRDLASRAEAASPTRLSSGKRLQRLLALMTWIARTNVVQISEVAERFRMTEAEVVRELELAACCGLPPYTPDQLIEIVVVGDRVMANMGAQFRSAIERPRRLAPSEAWAAVAATRIMLQVPGIDPGGSLASASAKLERALGYHRRLAVSLHTPPNLEIIKRAVQEKITLEVSYYAVSTDEVTERLIDPISVFSAADHWYVDAYCHRAGDQRRFRIDRLLSVREPCEPAAPAEASQPARCSFSTHHNLHDATYPGEDPNEPREEERRYASPAAGSVFVPSPETIIVTLSIPTEERWITEVYPTCASRDVEGGRLEVDIPVGGAAWLARLLLRLGADAKVVAPAELAGAGSHFAARILARYGAE